MNKIREITVFSVGDSNDVKLWSNVPFFFTKTLEDLGIKVNRVHLKENKILTFIFDRFLFRAAGIIFPGHILNFNKLAFNNKCLDKQIKRSTAQIPDSNVYLFLNYDYSIKTAKPVVLFHDWTFEHNIRVKLKRKPFFFEKPFIKYQEDKIEKADIVLSLFRDCAEEMKTIYKNPNIYFLGGNVVNNFDSKKLDGDELATAKKNSRKLLFIGNYKYKKGAFLLLQAYMILKKKYADLTLDFIGLDSSDFESLPEGVTCHGYLDKSSVSENAVYYKLLREASIFVNPTPTWAGYSSTVEAMYYYCPIIVSPYKDFINEFGENIPFGIYNKSFDAAILSGEIEHILFSDDFKKICFASHEAVKNYTWVNYVEKFLKLVEEKCF